MAPGDGEDDLVLAGAQGAQRELGPLLCAGLGGGAVHQPAGDLRGQDGIAGGDPPDRLGDLARGESFRRKPLAPARSARSTFSSASKVVSTEPMSADTTPVYAAAQTRPRSALAKLTLTEARLLLREPVALF
jgi:hypothetical protein